MVEKAADGFLLQVASNDPNALNTLLAILQEDNRDGDILSAADRNRIREIVKDLLTQFWPSEVSLVGNLLGFESDSSGSGLLGPPAHHSGGGLSCDIAPEPSFAAANRAASLAPLAVVVAIVPRLRRRFQRGRSVA